VPASLAGASAAVAIGAATGVAGVPVLVGGGLVSTVTTDAEDMPQIDYSQPPTIALHLVEDGHLVTHWRTV